MSEERDPVRLRDDPSEDASLREMLDAARGEHAEDAMLARVLGSVLASGGGGGSGGSGTTAATGKIVAAIGAALVGAGVIAMMATRAPEPSRPPIAIADAAVVLDAYVMPDAFEPSDAGTDAFVIVAHVVPRSPPPSTTSAIESDGALLMRATRTRDAAQRLALAREHRGLYPNSASAEVREAMIVIALAELDQSAEAHAAADAFFARWPTSPARSHIESTLARMH